MFQKKVTVIIIHNILKKWSRLLMNNINNNVQNKFNEQIVN